MDRVSRVARNFVGLPLDFKERYLLHEGDQQRAVCISLEQTLDQRYKTGIYHVAGVGRGMY